MSAIQNRINDVTRILKQLEEDYGTFVLKTAIKLRIDSYNTGKQKEVI